MEANSLKLSENGSPKLERQPLGPKSANVRAISACDQSCLEASGEVKAEGVTGKITVEVEEKELNTGCEGDPTRTLSVEVPSAGHDDSMATRMHALPSKNVQASPSPEEEPSALETRNISVSALSINPTRIGADTPVVKVRNKLKPMTKRGSLCKIKENSKSTVPAIPGSVLEGKSAVDANEHKTRKLRSTAPSKTAIKTNLAEQSNLTKEICTYLEPLTNLEGVVSEIKHLSKWYEEWTLHCHVIKIAEGSFGSVFRLSDKEGLQEPTIGKLMPLRPKSGKGSRKPGYTHIADAVSEIRLLETMSQVPGFVEFRSAEVLIGELPKPFKQEYRSYKAKCKGNKESFCDLRYPDDQTWVFIEMGNAGTELEDALLPETEENMILEKDEKSQWVLKVQDVRDIFWGVAEALANGEEAQEFEHRDLHFSNICIQRKQIRKDNGYLMTPSDTNIEVTLIDYTLSRATLSNGAVVCNRMTDQGIFSGDDDLQFDVYRWMREEMSEQNPHSKKWEAFVPMTNVLWLYHLLEKLMALSTRSEVCGDERSLWESLNELKCQINPNNKHNKRHASATDVVNHVQNGIPDLEGLKDEVNQDNLNDSPEEEISTEHDLSARFECVKI